MNRKKTVITGCTRGFGLALLRKLLHDEERLCIIIFTTRNENEGKDILRKFKRDYPDSNESLFYHQLDITNRDSIEFFSTWIEKEFGQIDILINNAGKYYSRRYEEIINTRILGTYNLTKKFLDHKLINENGKIINVANNLGRNYSLAKMQKVEFYKLERGIADLIPELANNYKAKFRDVDALSFSKLVIHLYSKLLGNNDLRIKERNIAVYAMDPGCVENKEHHTVEDKIDEKGVDLGIFLIKMSDGINPDLQGKLFNSVSEPPVPFVIDLLKIDN